MKYRQFPKNYEMVHLQQINTDEPYYNIYKFEALNKHKYENFTLKALVFKATNFKETIFNKYKEAFNMMGYVPDDFILGPDEYFLSSDLYDTKRKNKLLITFYETKTLKEYISEIKKFNNTNKANNTEVAKNLTSVKELCIAELKTLHANGFCLPKINMTSFAGNYNLSIVYLQNIETIKLCDSDKHRESNLKKLANLF